MQKMRFISRMRTALAAAMACALLLTASPAKASLLTSFAGNTQPVNGAGSGLSGFVNFAVYSGTDGTGPGDDRFGTGIANSVLTAAGFNVASPYLYLFQTANNGTLEISQNTVAAPFANVTGVGALAGRGFTDNAGNVSASNPFGTPAAPGDPSGPSIGVVTPGIALVAGLMTPTSVNQTTTSVAANFTPPVTGLAAGVTSSLWGYTALLPPDFRTTSIQDGGTNAAGIVPSSVAPEPTTMGSALVGLLLAGGYCLRRRKV